MIVKFTPTKTIFQSNDSDFKVMSCNLVGKVDDDFKLNKYGNFTVSGNNMENIVIGEEYEADLAEMQDSKYDGSYKIVGYSGIGVGEEIVVDPSYELKLLAGIMTGSQAKNVNDAYPNFINLVLNGHEDTIDHEKIHNVGEAYLELYIEKVKKSYRTILFYSVLEKYHLNDKVIDLIAQWFVTPELCEEQLKKNPYEVLINVGKCSFTIADKKIIELYPELIDSAMRCEFGCIEILRQNEECGDTRIDANIMSRFAKELVPEAKHHMKECVLNSVNIHYDEKTKTTAFVQTYVAECQIAEAIKARLAPENRVVDTMEWENFIEVDGLKCTDEQSVLPRLANEERIALLTGLPGSGKTTSVKATVSMLKHYMRSFALLAPTGIASKQLRLSTGSQAQTIHSFVNRARDLGTSVDFIIVDEVSMVGVHLLSELFQLAPNSRFILIGDDAQLASISCGNVLTDILESNIIPRANLTKVFRYGVGMISTVTNDARNGKKYLSASGEVIAEAKENDFIFESEEDDVVEQTLRHYKNLLSNGYKKNEILILCPFRVSKVGVNKINEVIQEKCNSNEPLEFETDKESVFKVGDRVMCTENCKMPQYTEEDEDDVYGMPERPNTTIVCNGDLGTIVGHEEDVVLGKCLVVDFDGDVVYVSEKKLSNITLGYCMSVHKCQGCESRAVLLVTAKIHKKMLTRNLLYVGLSRAKELLIQIGDPSAILYGLDIEETKERATWLHELLPGGEDSV